MSKETENQNSPSQLLKTDGGKTKSNSIEIPSISLPKGGGAIKGIDEKFSVNAVNGTASFSIPLPFSPARGASPALNLSYNSGSGNGIFGLGWSLGLSSIKRKTDKRLPQYLDSIESDTFLFSEAEDLRPLLVFNKNNQKWEREILPERNLRGTIYQIQRYRPRIEGLFARIERWTSKTTGEIRWRVITKENITTLFGWSAGSRISDPKADNEIFEWLPEFVFDDKGNCSHYIYKREDKEGFIPSLLHNRNRTENGVITYTHLYLEKVLYGNKTPYKKFNDTYPNEQDYMFQTVFDYGEYNDSIYTKTKNWEFRADAFSEYKSGFEIRTTRLCKRVLLFHHFAELSGGSALVKSLNFEYDTSSEADFTFLKFITTFGYIKKPDDTYMHKNLPPLEFKYQKHDWNTDVKCISPDALVHAPTGLDEPLYQFIDLFNEGISGILTEQANGWYYKHNLGNGNFEQAKLVSPKPSFAGLGGQLQLADLDADGGKQLVSYGSQPKGYFELSDEDEWQPFRTFESLPNIDFGDANTRMLDLNGDGKPEVLVTEDNVFTWYESAGRRGFTQAYQTPKSFDEEKGPHLVFADPTQSIFLADMSGDGLTDIVRIRNGEVCYWPNLGYGKFGAKVSMDNAPVFDYPGSFNPTFLRLADIDGSGTTDIIYLGKNKFTCWKNLSGNRFNSAAFEIDVFPEIHNQSKITVTDLLGNGVACIVWSSNLTKDAHAPLKYIDLMNSRKPHIMVSYKNNLGKEVTLEYTSSTAFYLKDKKNGKPWVTKLHFPVHCVEKITVKDKWRSTEFSSTYSYHHGYYDSFEREFRGFGRVEKRDVESYGKFEQGNIASPYITNDYDLYQPPIKTITWYHTGAAFERDRILSVFRKEYFAVSGFTEHPLPDPQLTPDDLSPVEWREAARACKGMVLRQEVFELDVDALTLGEELPVRLFTTAYHNSDIKRLQPQGINRHAVFLVTESEAITYNYELDLRNTPLKPDPRIAHTLNLSFDDYGRALQSVAVVYPRMVSYDDPANILTSEQLELIRKIQSERHLAYTETHYTDELPDEPDQHRLPAPCEVLTYELTGSDSTNGFTPSIGLYFSLDDLRAFKLSDTLPAQGSKPVTKRNYHEQPLDETAHKRIVEWVRMLYFKDDLSGSEPFGTYAWYGLPYETYKLALTKDLLGSVLGTKLTPDVLTKLNTATISGYTPSTALSLSFTNQWWIRSGIAGFASDAKDHFYLPEEYTDPFGNKTTLSYDGKYDLFIQSSTDACGNTTRVEQFDYRVLAPREMVDINGNHTEVYFDILGMVVASAIKGKNISADPAIEEWEADNLIGFDDELANPSIDAVQAFHTDREMDQQQASDWLANATARFVYHFGEEHDSQGKVIKWEERPAGACGISREIHFHVSGGDTSPLQIALECSDGSGNVLMKKVQAEPDPKSVVADPPLRWIVNGLTILNNKGKPVKQYEPDFSLIGFGCEMPGPNGVTPIMYYDAAGRLIRTEMPDGSFSHVEFSPWHVRSFDQNDTAYDPAPTNQTHSDWYKRRTDPAHPLFADFNTAENRRAADLVKVHANTPAQVHLDSLGREVIAIAHNRLEDANGTYIVGSKHYSDEYYLTFTKLDAEGKPLWIRDARGNLVMQYITPAKANNDPSDAMPVGSVPCYDIAGNLLFQHSMDAGDRWMLMDAAGKPMLAWDSRDNVLMSSYDALHRPTTLELKNPIHPAWIIVGLTQYGEETTGDQANNRRGMPYRSFDQSGMVTNQEFDFKGNARRVNRRLANDYEVDTDWRAVLQLPLDQEPVSLLMAETFAQLTEYDALNRMTRQYNWHRAGKPVAVYEPGYNARGLLVSEDLTVGARKTATGHSGGKKTSAIRNISYDAKGQRLSVIFDNNVTNKYTYDPNTFRLLTLVSTRPSKPILQNLSYTYDPSGNITEIFDAAVPTEFFNNAVIEPRKRYVYDALYRLIEATGREHADQIDHDDRDNWNDCSYRVDYGPNSKAWRNYIQRYTYDSVGNILVMQHTALGSSTNSWTRKYQYAIDSNRLLATGMGAATVNHYVTSPTLDYLYDYNIHGSMTSLPHLPTMDWDYTEHLRHISRAPTSQSTDPDGCQDSSLEAWYRYDAAKQRTRKRVKKQGGLVEERFYLGGLEWYRRTLNNALVEEIETLHLFDGEHRLLMVDQVLETDRPELGKRNLYRYTLSNHLGSSTVEVDENADIISYEEYHPYGTTAYQSGRNAAEVKLKRYRYTGMERDEESGLGYHGTRFFVMPLGRWLSTDPYGVAASRNLYRYAACNPINSIDADGTQEKRWDKMTPQEQVMATGAALRIREHNDELRAEAADPMPAVPEWKSRPYEEPTEVKIVKKGVLLLVAGLLALPTGGTSVIGGLAVAGGISGGIAVTATGMSLDLAKDIQPVSAQDEKHVEMASDMAINFSNPGGAVTSSIGALVSQTPEGIVQYGNVGTKVFDAALLVHTIAQPKKATQAVDDLSSSVSDVGVSKMASMPGSSSAISIPAGLLQDNSTTASRWMTQSDVDALAVSFVEHLPDAVRQQFVRNETVAIALVQDAAGQQYLFYAVAGNRTSPAIRATAEQLCLIRVTATPRAVGRGAVGAPADAEQLLIEAFSSNPEHKILGVPAATRPYCADCSLAVQHR